MYRIKIVEGYPTGNTIPEDAFTIEYTVNASPVPSAGGKVLFFFTKAQMTNVSSNLYLLEDILYGIPAVVAEEVRILPGEFSVGRPVVLAGQAAAGEEVLSRQHLLPRLPGVCVVEVAVVVINLLVGVDRPGGHHHALPPVVGP